MKEIIKIIFKRNSENQIVTPDDIVRITNILKSICGTDILEYLNEVDEYELFINGLIRDKEKTLNLASSLVIM